MVVVELVVVAIVAVVAVVAEVASVTVIAIRCASQPPLDYRPDLLHR